MSSGAVARRPQPPATMWRSLLLFLLLSLPLGGGGPLGASAASSCPLSFAYVYTYPWDPSPCAATANLSDCCTTLTSLIGIAFGVRLRDTGLFRLPSTSASIDCLADLQSNLSASPLSLPSGIVPYCFPNNTGLAITRDFCAGILSRADWDAKLGNSTVLDSACRGDLTDLYQCSACEAAGKNVSSQLTTLDGDPTHAVNCFRLMIVYATGVVGLYGPEDSRTSSCTLGLAIKKSTQGTSGSHTTTVLASVSASLAFVLASFLIGFFLWRSHQKKKAKAARLLEVSERNSIRPHISSIWFDIKEIEKATAYFSQRNLIGRGGFGVVYKGTLSDGSLVAVKKVLDPETEGNDVEFRNEVEIISHLRHRNLVPLRGCCITDDDPEEGKQRYLVYDYMPNGSLDDHIFDTSGNDGSSSNGYSGRKRAALTWPQRKNIILDVAKGLMYLHYGVKPAIFHRDIKATNILLDAEMRARVADFGLARQSREGQSHLTTRVAGTHGYLAPEYALYGQLTEKSDVYSFGVLVLETMSGRRSLDTSATSNLVLITDWAWTLVKSGRAEEVLDDVLREDNDGKPYPKGIMERFVLVGILCSHVMVALRPTISDALKMLEGDIDVPAIPDRPMPLFHGSVYGDGSTFTASPALSGPSLNAGDMLR